MTDHTIYDTRYHADQVTVSNGEQKVTVGSDGVRAVVHDESLTPEQLVYEAGRELGIRRGSVVVR